MLVLMCPCSQKTQSLLLINEENWQTTWMGSPQTRTSKWPQRDEKAPTSGAIGEMQCKPQRDPPAPRPRRDEQDCQSLALGRTEYPLGNQKLPLQLVGLPMPDPGEWRKLADSHQGTQRCSKGPNGSLFPGTGQDEGATDISTERNVTESQFDTTRRCYTSIYTQLKTRASISASEIRAAGAQGRSGWEGLWVMGSVCEDPPNHTLRTWALLCICVLLQ